MSSNFYRSLHKALISDNVNTKELIVNELLVDLEQNIKFDNNYEPMVFNEPSYRTICKIVAPKNLPKRRDFSTKDGLIALVHSIAHIEYSAIDLAVDAVYRFPNMSNEYKKDWLIVAQDEIRHFKMLSVILSSLDSFYGELPVHIGLFEVAFKSNKDIIERMAIIPRYFEATGLDVNPKIISKLNSYKSTVELEKVKEALNIIYLEEIDHVRKGDKWFKYLCDKSNFDYIEKYQEIIEKYRLSRDANSFNIEARKEAGFSCKELKIMGAKSC